MTHKNTTTVIYVMGATRSGSTVLDIVLGNHPDIQGLGELVNLIPGGWINREYCSCGRQGDACPFWSRIRSAWVKRIGAEAVDGYASLQGKYEHFKRWPLLLLERSRPSERYRAYLRSTLELFESIREVSGKPALVDSSKNPGRALALSMIPELKLRLIHLVRDGRGVTWSHMKSFRKDDRRGVQRDLSAVPAWRTGLRWLLVNMVSEFVLGWSGSQGVRIRYEDFIERPKETLVQIGRLSDINLDSIAEDLSCGKPMTTGHIIAGNRLRMEEAIYLKRDLEWRSGLSKRAQAVFWLWAGHLAKRYGYDKAC